MDFTQIESSAQFTHLFEEHWENLYGYALNWTKSEHEAEEQVQELFFQIWMKRAAIKVQENWEAYLIIALKHQLYHYGNKQKNRKYLVRDLYFPVSEEGQNIAEAKLSLKETYQIIQCLSPAQRPVFILNKIKGYSILEISKILSISTHTVKSHLQESKTRLRKFANHFLTLF